MQSEATERLAPARGRHALIGVVKLALGLTLIGALVYLRRDALAALDLDSLRWRYLLLGALGLVLVTLITFSRWYALVRVQGLPFRLRQSFELGFVGFAFNLLLPGAIGGDVVKAVLVARQQQRRAVAAATVVMDRILGLVGLTWLAGFAAARYLSRDQGASPLMSEISAWTLGVWVIANGALALSVSSLVANRLFDRLVRLPVIGRATESLLAALRRYRSRLGVVAGCIAISIFSHLLLVLSLWTLGRSTWSSEPALGSFFLIVPLGLLASSIPLTPGGLGVAELAMDRLFVIAGLEAAASLSMMLAFRAVQLLIAAAGIGFYLLHLREDLRRATPVA